MKNIHTSRRPAFFVGLAALILLTGSIQFSFGQVDRRSSGSGQKQVLANEWYLPTGDEAVPYLYVYTVGKGDPVIVLHGGPGMGHLYMTDIANGLSDRFRFVFYDQRGAGLSHSYAPGGITLEKNVQDIERLRKALNVDRISLISHSAGTYLAMKYLQTYPKNVKNIALVGATDPQSGDKKFFTKQELATFAGRGEEVRKFEERPAVKAEIKKAGVDRPRLTIEEEYLRDRIRSAGGTIYHVQRWPQYRLLYLNRDAARGARIGQDAVYDWSGMLSAHPFPVTVINGEFDYAVGTRGSPIWKRVVNSNAKNVKLVVIEKAGHNCWLDDPLRFRTALRDALSSR